MARIVSFVVLVAILLVIGGLFFQVMASFLLPMFLAVLLTIMFHPLHRWMLRRCSQRNHLAAGLTTTAILLIVLVPLLAIMARAIAEGSTLLVPTEANPAETPLAAGGEKWPVVQDACNEVVRLGARAGVRLDAKELQATATGKLQEWLYPVVRGTTQFLGQFLLGIVVMIVSLYYFLADGPQMVGTIMRFSPLDQRYKQQLVDRFVNVSRAVILATLLSAGIQGLLAGVGFYLAGFSSLLLLVVLAMLLAMVPFLGPPILWIGGCLWLYFYEGRPTATILLGIYGAAILATVDNIVRLLVLRGRSNLHPLLGLLSVLGGVQALGAIGIFVGPMVVALLQTLLEILHEEMEAMGEGRN